MKKLVVLIALFTFVINPIIGQSKNEKKAAKAEKALQEYSAMKSLINSGDFEFIGDWANSQSGKRINLMSNPTSLKMENKEVDGYLPFFGTSRGGGGAYGGNGAIEFKGSPEGYAVEFDDKKQRASIKFSIKGTNSSEKHDIIMTVFGSGSSTVNITSTNRSVMNYTGNTSAISKKDTN